LLYSIKVVVVIERVETVENTVPYGKRLMDAVEKMWNAAGFMNRIPVNIPYGAG
jgi:hypothetical protein